MTIATRIIRRDNVYNRYILIMMLKTLKDFVIVQTVMTVKFLYIWYITDTRLKMLFNGRTLPCLVFADVCNTIKERFLKAVQFIKHDRLKDVIYLDNTLMMQTLDLILR